MRVCGTARRLTQRAFPWANDTGRSGLISSRSEPRVVKTAKSSKTIRANERKAELKAKHRRQRARATG
jgi:hypothetical protein